MTPVTSTRFGLADRWAADDLCPGGGGARNRGPDLAEVGAMPSYSYYIVEHSFIVRYDPATCEAARLEPDGTWTEYRDLWDISTNGRQLRDEAEALAEHRELLEMFGDG